MHIRTAWGVQRGGRRPQAACLASGPPVKQLLDRFMGCPTIGCRRVGHGRPGWNFRESMATPCHTPMTLWSEMWQSPGVKVMVSLSLMLTTTYALMVTIPCCLALVCTYGCPKGTCGRTWRCCWANLEDDMHGHMPRGSHGMDSLKFHPGPPCPTVAGFASFLYLLVELDIFRN
jgi:hypothetical protein